MDILSAIGLGILQGATEFLPVSSSGHLSVIEYMTGLEETPRFFDLMLHVGTLLAIFLYYGRSGFQIVRDGLTSDRSSRNRVLLIACFAVVATLPVVATSLVFRPTKLQPGQELSDVDRDWRHQIGDLREHSSRLPQWVLTFMAITGVVLTIASRARSGSIDATTMNVGLAIAIGIAQAFSATFPGLSRSGMTVSAGLLLGLRSDWAVHFSLLMSIPAVLGGAVLKAKDADPAWIQANIAPTILGTVVSAIVGYLCITLLLRAVQRGRWWWFGLYVWAFVAVCTILIETKVVPMTQAG